MRQKDTTKILNLTSNSDKRVSELELALNRMKQQQEILQKKLKEDSEKKLKLEKELEKEQQKIKELQSRNEQQQKILKKKTEDLATAQRKLRSGSALGLNEDPNSTTSKHWVEQEIEKVLQEKKQIEIIKEELSKREDMCRKKEALLQEKNELQIKKLRSSQVIKESLSSCTQKIETLEKQMVSGSNKEALQKSQYELMAQRRKLDERLSQGNVLSTAEERRLIEIEEALEALETAIEYENESIKSQEAKLKKSQVKDVSSSIIGKLSDIPHEEAKALIGKFFHKIINLKEGERKAHMLNEELQIQLDEKNRLVDEFKKSLNISSNDLERKLTAQQQQYEKQINVLMDQLNECSEKIFNYEKEISSYRDRISVAKRPKTAERFFSGENASVDDANGEDALRKGGMSSRSSHSHAMDYQATERSHVASARSMSSNNLKQSESKCFFIIGVFFGNFWVVFVLVKDSLSDSVNPNQMTTVKVSKKGLRPLTEDEILKRAKKGSS